MAGKALETKWGVADIQAAIVRYTQHDESIPNVSFGFFNGIECDLVQVSDSGYLHEFEIKRSWGDFMADFRKRHFHDDVRLYRLTFALPESFAGDRLRKFCADNYEKFEREFDFLFYMEDGDLCHTAPASWRSVNGHSERFLPEDRFLTSTYITDEMRAVIRRNDKAAPYRRRLFTEELARLYRLGVIRLWHRTPPDDEKRMRDMLDALVRIGNWCAQDLAENAYVGEASGNYEKTLRGLCDICRPYMEQAAKLEEYGGTEDGD